MPTAGAWAVAIDIQCRAIKIGGQLFDMRIELEATHRLQRKRIENFHGTRAPRNQNEFAGCLRSKLQPAGHEQKAIPGDLFTTSRFLLI